MLTQTLETVAHYLQKLAEFVTNSASWEEPALRRVNPLIARVTVIPVTYCDAVLGTPISYSRMQGIILLASAKSNISMRGMKFTTIRTYVSGNLNAVSQHLSWLTEKEKKYSNEVHLVL